MSDVLYLENDEDIASAVEKLKAAEGSDIQVVVPKRSTLLQSMINLKLLKKAADASNKNLVLVTTDRLSSHLAGRVGLPVAQKLGAEATVPETSVKEPDQATDVIDGGVAETGAAVTTPTATAGEAEPKPDKPAEAVKSKGEDQTAKTTKPEAPVMATKAIEDDPASATTKKAARVPDFNALQRRILWGSLAVFIVLLLLFGNYFLAKANVTIYAKGSQVPVSASLTADPNATAPNPSAGIIKAQQLTSSKDLSEQVPATGQQDVGTKANGQITVSNANDSNSHSLPAGTKFSASGKLFDSTTAATVPGASVCGGHICPGTATVSVQAEQAGDSYNLAPTSYSVSGQPGLSGQGGQMSGGTTKVVTVVQQSDVDKAVADLLAKDKDGAQQDLANKAPNGYKMIPASFTQASANPSGDPAVGTQASNVNVKVTANYSALAIANSDLDNFLRAQVLKQVGQNNQVYDDGAGQIQYNLSKTNNNGSQVYQINTVASAGPKLDTTAIAAQLKGRKYGDATDVASKIPGVDHADIHLWPGWNTSLPSRSSRISIQIKVAQGNGG